MACNKNIYSGTDSGIPLYLGLFETGLLDKVVETAPTHLKSHLSLFLFQLESTFPARGTPPVSMDVFPRCTDAKVNSRTTAVTGN